MVMILKFLDSWELNVGLDPNKNDAQEDPDGDTLTNKQEFELGTLPKEADTDKDGLNDAEESKGDTDPLIADADRDGLLDGQEKAAGTDPNNRDSDGDGAPDNWELEIGSNPLSEASPGKVVLADLGEPVLVVEEAGETTSLDVAVAGGDKLDATFSVCVDFDAKLDGARELIWETGGGTVGISLMYEAGNKLVARTAGNGGFTLVTLEGVLPQSKIDTNAVEVLVSYDVENDDFTQTFTLWIDGVPVDSKDEDLGGDWSGNNAAHFAVASSNATGNGSNGSISGEEFTSGTIDVDKGWAFFSEVLPEIVSFGGGNGDDTAFRIINVEVDPQSGDVTLSWNSEQDASYAVDSADDLVNWIEEQDGVASDGARTSFTLEGAAAMGGRDFFRVRRE